MSENCTVTTSKIEIKKKVYLIKIPDDLSFSLSISDGDSCCYFDLRYSGYSGTLNFNTELSKEDIKTLRDAFSKIYEDIND